MIAAIHQPQYIPWLGYIDKIDKADVFCFLDNVQYKKNDWQNRNRIKTVSGWQWLTVPVSFRFPQPIKEVRINNTANWGRKHLQALHTNYRKAPFFEQYIDSFQSLFTAEWQDLSDLNIAVVKRLLALLGLGHKRLVLASALSTSDDPNGRLIDICRTLGCDTYLAGSAGANYMDMARFEKGGINVVFQKFRHPEYPQLFGDFVSHLSSIDLLFNCGPDSLQVVRGAKPW